MAWIASIGPQGGKNSGDDLRILPQGMPGCRPERCNSTSPNPEDQLIKAEAKRSAKGQKRPKGASWWQGA